jgi:hypothetical protein
MPSDDHLKILCAPCPAASDGKPVVIPISQKLTETRCPSCKRRFTLDTRKVAEVHTASVSDGVTSYRLVARDGDGRLRAWTFQAQQGLRISPGQTLTLVRRGGHLIGVANQDESAWWTVPEKALRVGAYARFWRVMLAVCGVLIAAQSARWVMQAESLVVSAPASLAVVVALAGVGAAALAFASGKLTGENDDDFDPYALLGLGDEEDDGPQLWAPGR